ITGDGEAHPFILTDYSAYYRALKARLEALVERNRNEPGVTTYPDPVDHCGICRWADECKDRRRADDHLSLVSWHAPRPDPQAHRRRLRHPPRPRRHARGRH